MGFEKSRRVVNAPGFETTKFTTSTAASTALDPRGVIGLRSTSTGGPVVYTFNRVPDQGERVVISAQLVGATSVGAGFHVNAASGSFFGSSSQDMATMLGQGNSFTIVGFSTTIWAVEAVNGATFSTST